MDHDRHTALANDRGQAFRDSGDCFCLGWLLRCGLLRVWYGSALAAWLIFTGLAHGMVIPDRTSSAASATNALTVRRNVYVYTEVTGPGKFYYKQGTYIGEIGYSNAPVGSSAIFQYDVASGSWTGNTPSNTAGVPITFTAGPYPNFIYSTSVSMTDPKSVLINPDGAISGKVKYSGEGAPYYISYDLPSIDIYINRQTGTSRMVDPLAPDQDGDGITDAQDPDDDNDGIPDTQDPDHPSYVPPDADGDGTPDSADPDDDNDGIPDNQDPHPTVPDVKDSDGDGIVDAADPDDDNDGINDVNDTDDDNNGIADPIFNDPPPIDSDGDNIPDYVDTDDDGDNIDDQWDNWPKDPNNGGTGPGDGNPDPSDPKTPAEPGSGFGVGGKDMDPNIPPYVVSPELKALAGEGKSIGAAEIAGLKADIASAKSLSAAMNAKFKSFQPGSDLAVGGGDFTGFDVALGGGRSVHVTLPLNHPGIPIFRACCLFAFYWVGIWKLLRILKI